jgi:hypothetical protein
VNINISENLLTNVGVYCKIEFGNKTQFVKTQLGANQNILICLISVEKLKFNTELVKIGLVVNSTEKIFDITMKSINYVFLKEPIKINGIQKVITPNNIGDIFQLNISDLIGSEFVSYQSYSVELFPELHPSLKPNCSRLNCTVPNFSFTSTPVKISSKLTIHSNTSQNDVVVDIEDFYFKGILD